MMQMHCERRAEHQPEIDCEARPGAGKYLADWDIGFRQLPKRVHAQGPTTLDRSGQNRNRADFLPPQARNRLTSE
jgi:hypothetical protein